MSEERVEFFGSESSFGSQSSLASSRFFDLTNQIAQETDALFNTLRKQFLPTKQLTNFDKIQYLNNRANIISNDTVPQHIQYLNKIGAPKQAKQTCKRCSEQLKKFMKDFQALKNGTMLHKQFYNMYGRSNENNVFFKKDGAGIVNVGDNNMMEPDVVEVQAVTSRVKPYNEYNMTSRNQSQIGQSVKSKQIKDLNDQISRMKKREAELKREFDQVLNNEKINCEKRIKLFLNGLDERKITSDQYTEQLNNYKNQLTISKNQLEAALKEKQWFLANNRKHQERIIELERESDSLTEELADLRKLQNIRTEQMMQQQDLNESYHSEFDQSSNHKKLQNDIKKLKSQRYILKNQLTKERENFSKEKHNFQEDQSKEVLRLKKYLQLRNEENQDLKRNYDKLRVDVIQLTQQNKKLKKQLETIKESYENLKMRAKFQNYDNVSVVSTNLYEKSDKNINFRKSKVENPLQVSIVNKLNGFEAYQGQGIEGYPYYELLPKQFKIRFKRSCLKNKELLFKSDGLEVGVISEFLFPNVIKVLVHITNSSEGDIKSFKIKALNPNDNKVNYEVEQIKVLAPNQQVKIPISCTIRNYPIGPVVLVLDYMAQIKHDIRLLLPVHIFKCVSIEPRQQKLDKPIKFSIKVERKMCKDFNGLKQYLNCENENKIQVKIRHEHSNSAFFLNAYYINEEVQIEYEHVQGFQNFTQYFVKTFRTLLQKQN